MPLLPVPNKLFRAAEITHHVVHKVHALLRSAEQGVHRQKD